MLADHAEALGTIDSIRSQDPALIGTKLGKNLFDQYQEKSIAENTDPNAIFKFGVDMWMGDIELPDTYKKTIWSRVGTMADKHNQPGQFTAFIGYEWTSYGRMESNIHRVVIFADSADKTKTVLPFSFQDSLNPEDLWRFMENYQQQTSGEVLAIAHNGNVSNGEMFGLENFSGQPINVDYAKTRSRWEPLYEVTQIKGDGEAHPLLSPDDEFADFETWNSWYGRNFINDWSEAERKFKTSDYSEVLLKQGLGGWNENVKKHKQSEYARSGLKLGLQQQAVLGVNPFKFGMIGSTDSHTSLATADDSNFWGKAAVHEPSVNRMFTPLRHDWPVPAWETAASGYAAIWAEENTRKSLFAAMKRKEVYASTGPRMTVRFFGGWDYQANDAFKPDLADIGYSRGVPMGGDLTNAPDNKFPRFLIRAIKDPDGANLDRVQIIKGWLDKEGELHEKVYNIALSDGRKENRKGKVKPIGSTVDIPNASYSNTIGDPELAVVWQDPDFDKDELAFYYVRVLEIPTPRWTAYDAKFFGLKDVPEQVPMETQERAYTSPIWYTPENHSISGVEK